MSKKLKFSCLMGFYDPTEKFGEMGDNHIGQRNIVCFLLRNKTIEFSIKFSFLEVYLNQGKNINPIHQ